VADEIVGTAVLCTTGPIQWLYYVRRTEADGLFSRDELPVMSVSGPAPAEKLPSWFPENRPWKYEIMGDRLQCHPSVHIVNHFHNAGQWTVKFEIATGATRQDHIKQLQEANPTIELSPFYDAEPK
jgi:hypothetical protein